MRPTVLFLVCSALAVAQDRQSDPVGLYHAAQAQGNFGEAAVQREEARSVLARTPVDSPQFGGWVQQIQQLYQSTGRHIQARAVIEEALKRATSFSESHPARIQLLNILADSWQADGNLLKALVYREQGVAAIEADPPGATQAASYPTGIGDGQFVRASRWFSGPRSSLGIAGGIAGPIAGISPEYQQLAELYRQLGRPDAASKTMAKVCSLIHDDPRALAAFYENQGNLDEAAALYRKQSEGAAINPKAQIWEVVGPLENLASLYQRQERWDEAAAALEQAASRVEASGGSQAGGQATKIRLNLANLLQQSGRTRESDQVYKALLSEASSETNAQVLQHYANHLSTTHRAGQAEDLLKSYLADHSDLQPWQEANMLSAMSNAAERAGDHTLAEGYRRAAAEKQTSMQPPQKPGRPLIGPLLEKARAAVNDGQVDEAANLTSQAIASASAAQDGEQIAWGVPSIASMLASKKAVDQGERLYQELLAQLQARSVDNVSPLIQALQQYAHFLIGQKDRWADVPGVIERYRDAVAAAYGADTSEFNQTILLRSEFARASEAPVEAEHAAEELLTHEASLSGVTSRPYLQIAQTAAGIYQFSGKPERGLDLRLQVVAIADQILDPKDPQRAFVRIEAANALMGARQWDEAERLASDAVGIAEHLPAGQADGLVSQLEHIRRMKAQAGRPRKGGTVLTGPLHL